MIPPDNSLSGRRTTVSAYRFTCAWKPKPKFGTSRVGLPRTERAELQTTVRDHGFGKTRLLLRGITARRRVQNGHRSSVRKRERKQRRRHHIHANNQPEGILKCGAARS